MGKTIAAVLTWCMLVASCWGAEGDQSSGRQEDGVIQVKSFSLPRSGYLGPATQAALKRKAADMQAIARECGTALSAEIKSPNDVTERRKCLDKYYYPGILTRQKAQYKVVIRPATIAGVATEIITPAEGISADNRSRVLINLHGGAFIIGARWAGQLESIPIAALGKIKVVSVNYRMAPEYRFPAASQDVVAVYKALLLEYKAENIGIYGCSAGGLLTAQSVAWILKQGLPTPGAVGMLCAGAVPVGGDSESLWAAITGTRSNAIASTSSKQWSYMSDDQLADPLAFPGLDPEMLARFPTSLLISSTRDALMSAVVITHQKLTRLGVAADLHVWEGLDHGFFYEPNLPESREAYDVIVRFFKDNLGPQT